MRLSKTGLLRVAAISVSILTIGAGIAGASGFALIEQGVSGLGSAYAGGAAQAEDATTIFYNPAGMSYLKKQEVVGTVHYIAPQARFHNEGSTHALQPVTGQELKGNNGGDGGVPSFVPNVYYAYPLSGGLAVGIGAFAPFGLATSYKEGWVGRYHALDSKMSTIDFNPSVSYKIGDLSLGGGLNVQQMKAELSSAIDFGTSLAALGTKPQGADGKADLTGDSWGFGYDLGLIYQYSEGGRVGASYRSRIKHTLDGDAEFTVPANVRALLNGIGKSNQFVDTGIKGDITLPDSLSLSIYHRFNPSFAAMSDMSWTHWGLFKELKIRFDNPAQGESVTNEGWRNTWRASVGVVYNPTPLWAVRLGLAYDQSPVVDKAHRTPRIPDGDRAWVAFGAGYKPLDWLSVDAGYAHIFVDEPKIDKSAFPLGSEDQQRGGLKGTYDACVDIASVQVTVNW